MLNLEELDVGVRLLSWNAELPSSGVGDPLGLTLRIGARLSDELSYCITSITPRARYYSFFPWAFQRARARLGERAQLNELMAHVLLDERAMLLGAVLNHDGQPCEGGGLQGSNGAATIATDPQRDPINLASWSHLLAKEGGFAAYKGSLINLGLFADTTDPGLAGAESGLEMSEGAGLTTGHLSESGERLARSFAEAVLGTAYLEREPKTARIAFEELKEFGTKAGLCELRSADPFDLKPLRELFFATQVEGQDNSNFRRRMTLLLVLNLAHFAGQHGLLLTREVFDDLTFYRRLIFEGGGSEVIVSPPLALQDVSERWRIFHFHSYLTTALEALLAGLVRSLRGHPGGLTIGEILASFDSPEAHGTLTESLPLTPSHDFWEMTPGEALTDLGVEVMPLVRGGVDALKRFQAGPTIERNLRSLLIGQGFASGPAGPAIAMLLLCLVVLRFRLTVEERYEGWNRQKVLNPNSDVSVPGVLDMLETQLGEAWWDRTNKELLAPILSRFVVRQHESMSYERGFGGSPPLFYLNGEKVIGTDLTRDEVDPGNARFPSILQILWDLRLLERDASTQQLTGDGRELLASHVGGIDL